MNSDKHNFLVSKAAFDSFETIRLSGLTNMFDILTVCTPTHKLKLSHALSVDECIEIIKHYEKYRLAYQRKQK